MTVNDRIKEAFSGIRAEDELKEKTEKSCRRKNRRSGAAEKCPAPQETSLSEHRILFCTAGGFRRIPPVLRAHFCDQHRHQSFRGAGRQPL